MFGGKNPNKFVNKINAECPAVFYSGCKYSKFIVMLIGSHADPKNRVMPMKIANTVKSSENENMSPVTTAIASRNTMNFTVLSIRIPPK